MQGLAPGGLTPSQGLAAPVIRLRRIILQRTPCNLALSAQQLGMTHPAIRNQRTVWTLEIVKLYFFEHFNAVH